MKKIFPIFLWGGCIPGTEDNKALNKVTTDNPWERPLRVLGYNDAWDVMGALFEAGTNCGAAHNMGMVTGKPQNMAFWSQSPPIAPGELSNPAPTLPTSEPYDPNTTYISLLLGDGDNLDKATEHYRWWKLRSSNNQMCPGGDATGKAPECVPRLTKCRGASPKCYPLVWTTSPSFIDMAPDYLRVFDRMYRETGADYRAMGPSGDTCSVPRRHMLLPCSS